MQIPCPLWPRWIPVPIRTCVLLWGISASQSFSTWKVVTDFTATAGCGFTKTAKWTICTCDTCVFQHISTLTCLCVCIYGYIYIYIHTPVYTYYIYIYIYFVGKNIYEYDFKLFLIYVHNILPPVMKHGQWDHSERKAVSQFPYRRVFSPLVLLGPGNYMVPCFYLSHGFCKSTNTSGEHHRVWKNTMQAWHDLAICFSDCDLHFALTLCPFLSIHCHFSGSFLSIPWCNPMFSGTQCCAVCFNF